MDVNDKVTALEDELKLLKAEIRNVLLDIREVVLERKNPLGEDEQSNAHITLDVNTTARAMASEAAANAAREAGKDVAAPAAPAASEPQPAAVAVDPEPVAVVVEPEASEIPEAEPPAEPAADPEPQPDLQDEPGAEALPATPEMGVTDEPDVESWPEDENPALVATMEPAMSDDTTEIPEMFMADLQPLSGDGSLADWVTDAIDRVGVEDLARVITMFRLWGNVPPNINRALAHLQQLLASSDDPQPAWLEVLQDLDRLASL